MIGLHGDGHVEVIFDPTKIGPEASYDRATGACAVSCHDLGGQTPRPTWNETIAITCNSCHLSPPAGHYPGSCTNCHAEANAAGTALTGPLHLNGEVDLGNGSGLCGACHGTGESPWPTTAAHPAHQNPTIALPIACSSCHVVPATITDPTHLDGTVEVTFTGLAVARGASPVWNGTSCTSVACHGANLADPAAVPVLGGPVGRSRGVRRVPRHSPRAAHDVHVVQPERLPRLRGGDQRAGGPLDLRERRDSSHRRHHRALRALRVASLHEGVTSSADLGLRLVRLPVGVTGAGAGLAIRRL